MRYTILGNTGLRVSVLSFGTMRLPISGANPDFSRSTALIRHAVNQGINFFDVGTFYCHDHCEEAFGLATRDLPHDRFIISGKNSSHQTGSPDWLGQLRNSLSQFGRDSFDIYFIHYLTLQHWESHFLQKGIIDQVLRAKAQGLYRHLGFSSHDTPENVYRLLDTGMFDAVILPFNLLQREHSLTMSYARQKGIGVIVMNPLAGGVLVDAAIYEEVCQTAGWRNLAENALSFVLSHPSVDTVLSGMTSESMIDENVRTVHNRRLTAPQMAQLESSLSLEKSKLFIPCTSCNYCMPCVQGIDIPEIIRIWNKDAVLTSRKISSRDYADLPVTADCCIECNDCVSRCPRGVNIPALMNDASRLFMTGL